MTNKNQLFLLIPALIAGNIFIIVGGIIAAEKMQESQAICPSGTIIKGRVALVLPECQKILQTRHEK